MHDCSNGFDCNLPFTHYTYVHDTLLAHHQGNVSAEIAYSSDNARWHFPALYHSKSYTSADGVTVDVILIDTVDLAGEFVVQVFIVLHEK